MTTAEAERVALEALAWIASTDDLLDVFLGAGNPETLAAVLDFLCMDDAWIRAFGDAYGLAYDAPLRARSALPGGVQLHWT